MIYKSLFLQDLWSQESINLLIQFLTFHSTSREEVFSKSINLSLLLF